MEEFMKTLKMERIRQFQLMREEEESYSKMESGKETNSQIIEYYRVNDNPSCKQILENIKLITQLIDSYYEN